MRSASQGEMLHRSYGVTVRAVDEAARTVDVVASTDAIDSYDEIVEQDWDLERYRNNPVVLWNHNRSSLIGAHAKDLLPIGCAIDCKVVMGQLEARLRFVDEKANPMAEMVYQGFKQGSIKAVSVGFYSKNARAEVIDGKDVYRLSGNVLCEISAVPMGANYEAVAKRDAQLAQLKAIVAQHERTTASAERATPPNEGHERAKAQEDIMEIKDLQATIAKLEADLRAQTASAELAQKNLDGVTVQLSAANDKITKLVVERDTAIADAKRADAAEKKALDAITERDVEALVGKKITPAQKPEWLDLARKSPDQFAKLAAGLPDMKLIGKALTDEATGRPGPTTGGADLGKLLDETYAD